jgi:hypothetical protein
MHTPTSFDSDRRTLGWRAAMGIYFAILALMLGIVLLVYKVYRVNMYRSGGVVLGIVYALAAVQRPWWVFAALRNVRAFGLLDDDDLVRILFAVFSVVFIGAALFWPG